MSSEPQGTGTPGEPPRDPNAAIEPPVELQDDELHFTGLPILRTWTALYAFVLVAFVLMVVLLSLFTLAYPRAAP